MPIYTKKGDGGETGLPGSRRLSKTEQIFEVLGNLDQTNALIGLALSHQGQGSDLEKMLLDIQSDLLSIGAFIASKPPKTASLIKHLPQRLTEFENHIDAWEEETGELSNFILPGGSELSATIQLARTIARQTERELHRLDPNERTEEISKYLNRLSDLLFQASRVANHRQNIKENIWKTTQN